MLLYGLVEGVNGFPLLLGCGFERDVSASLNLCCRVFSGGLGSGFRFGLGL